MSIFWNSILISQLLFFTVVHAVDGSASASIEDNNHVQVFQVGSSLELDPHFDDSHLVFSATVGQHVFGNSYYKPYSVEYVPPQQAIDAEFTHVTLTLNISSYGVQFDRLIQIFMSGVEIWRSSTLEPGSHNASSSITKDVTQYTSLFQSPQMLSVVLNNILDSKYTGPFTMSLTARYYNCECGYDHADENNLDDSLLGLLQSTIHSPPQAIVPLLPPSETAPYSKPYTWSIPPKLDVNLPLIPHNTTRLVLELSASGNAEEEFWYANILDEQEADLINIAAQKMRPKMSRLLIDHNHDSNQVLAHEVSNPQRHSCPRCNPEQYPLHVVNNLAKRASDSMATDNLPAHDDDTLLGAGPSRVIEVYINNQLAGFVFPFPVIYTGGIAPQLWSPMVAVSAFDVPFYQIDVTPFLPQLWNDPGALTLRIVNGYNNTQAINSNWLVNLQLLQWQNPHVRAQGGFIIPPINPPQPDKVKAQVYHQSNDTFNQIVCIDKQFEVTADLNIAKSMAPQADQSVRVTWSQTCSYENVQYFTEVNSTQYLMQSTMCSQNMTATTEFGQSLSLIQTASNYPLYVYTAFKPSLGNRYEAKVKHGMDVYDYNLDRSVSTFQNATAVRVLDESGAAKYGYGATSQNLTQRWGALSFYSREVNCVNNTVTFDLERFQRVVNT